MNPALSILIRRFAFVALLSVFLLSACGGGGGSAAVADNPNAPSVDSESLRIRDADSYSPLVLGPDADPSQPTVWFYQVNHGQPVQVEAEEGSFRLDFPDPMFVAWEPDAGARISDLVFRFAGNVPGRPDEVRGSGVLNRMEMFECGEGGTLLHAIESSVLMGEEREDPQFTIGAHSILEYESPLAWLPDCPDLGARLVAAEPVDAPLTHALLLGSVDSWLDGFGIRGDGFEYLQETPESWRVTETHDQVTVLGRRFTDVVVVEWQTLVIDLGCPEDPDGNEWRTVRMWFAKDVGMIRAEGALCFWGQPVDLELESVAR